MTTITNEKELYTDFVLLAGDIETLLQALKKRIMLMHQIYHERSELRKLSDDALKDLGIGRVDADQESNRSIFSLPDNRINFPVN